MENGVGGFASGYLALTDALEAGSKFPHHRGRI
jgi:hypothetical protein